MEKIAFDRHCPVCRTTLKTRISRKYWMHLLPGAKHYCCDYCGAHSILFFGKVVYRRTQPAILWAIR